MESWLLHLLLVIQTPFLFTLFARAETVPPEDAAGVALNWIALVNRAQGSWGDCQTAEVAAVEEIRAGNRRVEIRPSGTRRSRAFFHRTVSM